jgi:hypothetical protein
MILPKFRTTTLGVFLLLSIHWIFLGVSLFISFGQKGVGCTSICNTPPTMFSNKLGSLLLRLGWRPRKQSIPSNLFVSLVSRIILIRPLRLNGATWIFWGGCCCHCVALSAPFVLSEFWLMLWWGCCLPPPFLGGKSQKMAKHLQIHSFSKTNSSILHNQRDSAYLGSLSLKGRGDP